MTSYLVCLVHASVVIIVWSHSEQRRYFPNAILIKAGFIVIISSDLYIELRALYKFMYQHLLHLADKGIAAPKFLDVDLVLNIVKRTCGLISNLA